MIYAIATGVLLPGMTQMAARLVYLGRGEARAFELADLESAIQTVAKGVVEACCIKDKVRGREDVLPRSF